MKKVFLGLMLSVACTANSYAALQLELTQGLDSAIPIAIVPFGAIGDGTKDIVDNLNGVMTQDFSNTGRFKPVDVTGLQQPHTGDQVDTTYWQSQNVNDVIVGSVEADGKGRYNVSFALVDIFKNDTADSTAASTDAGKTAPQPSVAKSPILAQQTFTSVPAAAIRTLAHHIDDILYLQLTGNRGIFSTKIAYVLVQKSTFGKKRYALEISDYDGYNPQPILSSSEPIMSPAWAPDARHIAYVSFEDRMAAIYETDVITGKRVLISEAPGVNGAPAFSPNGQQLALVLTKTDELKIYLMQLSNKALTRVTDGYAIDTEPSWSPDGKSLIFTSDRAGGPQIYQLTLGSKKVQRLTFDGDYNARAAFTPDSKSIVMLHRDSADSPYSIATMNLDSGILQMLVQGYDVQSPSLAPNGSMIIYSNVDDGEGILAEVSTDGKVQLRLPSRDGDVRDPAWSPFWDK
ncbi:MAG: Tol-Pal system beta propeller repeat protein TolB [Gammaproteobacteria bacterium]|nr:Tol-Pal system beta propeller repeat protein TolB [Gammaproteobacteria bacterium]